jgi:hypothetical protein
LDQIYLEKEVEKLKIELARQLDFTCHAAFRAFDESRISNFCVTTFSETILDFASQGMFDLNQASLLFARYAEPYLSYS